MNRFIYLLLMVQMSFSSSAQIYTLNIIDGQAAGSFAQGDSVHIWADKTTSLQVFSHWSGDGAQYLLKADEWHSQLIVPTGTNQDEFDLMANYEELDNPTFGQMILNQWGEENEDGIFIPTDKIIHYAYPASPKAIAFFIHGTNGNGSSWFSNFEKLSIVKDFVHHGYAVFSLDSNETTLGDQDGDGKNKWENSLFKFNTTTNIDFKNIVTTKDYIDANLNFGSLPVFLVGGSNGANFSDFCTAALDYKASAHMTGNGLESLFENHPNLKPIIWVQSRNDNNPNTDTVKANNNYQSLVDQGIATEWHWLEPSPAYPLRFMRSLNGIGAAISTALFDSLDQQLYLNSEGCLEVSNVSVDFPLDDFVADFNLTNAQKNDFEYQLNVITADHGANGDFNKTIIRFFDDCLLATPVNELEELTIGRFSCYPNPADRYVYLEHKDGKAFDFRVVDINGRVLAESTKADVQHQQDVDMLPAGVYFISFPTRGFSDVIKLIKE